MTDPTPSTECRRCGRVPAEGEDHDFPALAETERRRFCVTAACDGIPAVDWYARARELEAARDSAALRVEKAEKQAAFLRLLTKAPDPKPCRNCGRVVLVGPACCEKPDIPPYETPIADLLARVDAAEAEVAALRAEVERLKSELSGGSWQKGYDAGWEAQVETRNALLAQLATVTTERDEARSALASITSTEDL